MRVGNLICRYSVNRVLNMVSSIKIGTHDGTFHADEALACFMLRKIPEYADAVIVRSRDPKLLNPCDIVVDVGGVYDPSKHRYDHHQNSFQETLQTLRPNLSSVIKLSSAGLVYHHFGEKVLEAVMGQPLDKVLLEKLFVYVYFQFMEEIDAVDNGVPMYEVGEPRYGFHTHLSARVAELMPPWNAKDTSSSMELFEKAMALTGKEFEECVFRFRDTWWPAREIVQEAIDNRFKTHPSGEIIELKFCPWKSHVFELEKEQGIENTIKFGIFEDHGNWRTSTVPLTPGSFVLRVPLHKEWQGFRDEELQKKSGVPDAVFVHATGFIGGTKSREGALALATKTLEAHKKASNGAS